MPRYRAKKMVIKQWIYSDKKRTFATLGDELDNNWGFIYAARIEVLQGFTLLKIGATRSPKIRFSCFGNRSNLFCVSPPCTNFWENEEILHKCFSKYRVPTRPNRGAQAEFFNLSMPYFLNHLPDLKYAGEK